MQVRIAYLQAGIVDLRAHCEATLRITENIEAALGKYADSFDPAVLDEMSDLVQSLREMHHTGIERVLVMDLGTGALASVAPRGSVPDGAGASQRRTALTCPKCLQPEARMISRSDHVIICRCPCCSFEWVTMNPMRLLAEPNLSID